MKPVLVTGFDPFGKVNENPSAGLAQYLAERDRDVNAAVIPTSYERGASKVIELLERLTPRLCIMFGYAKTPYSLRLELYGRNNDSSSAADNDGVVRRGPIEPDGDERVQTSVALYEIANILKQEGHNVGLSMSAGDFVCNHAYYKVLTYIKNSGTGCKALFVHVPGPELQRATLRAAVPLVEVLKDRYLNN